MPGVLLCYSVCQALKGVPWVGSYSNSVHQPLDGPASLLFICGCWLCGEREATVMAPSPSHDSAVSPCFHGCLTFLQPHFPPRSPSHPLNPSLHSQQRPLPWDCSIIPKLQLPAAAPSREPAFLSGVCMAAASTLILIPFRLPQISFFTLSLKCFSSDSDNCPDVGIRPLR